jgi:hypothetical protein
MNKVGRPTKYNNKEEYYDIRKEQYRTSKRRCRTKKKLINEIELMTPRQFNKKYQQDLINYINSYDFNYFFTGTIDLTKLEKQELWKMNEQIDNNNQYYQTENGYMVEKKVGIQSLRRYTEKYLDFLSKLNLIERSFVVFEIGKNNNYHVHIMFQSNTNKINFEDTTENTWLMGNSLTLTINQTHTDKTKLIGYCVKDLKPSFTKISDMNKVDNWFVTGDYQNNREETIKTKEIYCESSTILLTK